MEACQDDLLRNYKKGEKLEFTTLGLGPSYFFGALEGKCGLFGYSYDFEELNETIRKVVKISTTFAASPAGFPGMKIAPLLSPVRGVCYGIIRLVLKVDFENELLVARGISYLRNLKLLELEGYYDQPLPMDLWTYVNYNTVFKNYFVSEPGLVWTLRRK